MKRNTSFGKITLAAILFQSHFALAGEYTQQTNNDVNSAAELQPLVCPKVPQSPWFGGGTPPMVDEPACVQENNRRAQARAAAQGVQQTAGNVSTGDGTTLVAPTAPTYTCGSLDPYSSAFQSCKNAYEAAYDTYKKNLAAYNEAQKNIQNGQITAENAALAEQQQKTAAATLAEIKQKNDEGKKKFDVTGMITMGLGIAATIKGAACSATCAAAGTGCCPAAPYYYAVAAGMFLLNSMAKKQSSQHAAASQNACTSLNQLSTTATNCNTTGTDQTTNSTISYDPSTGACSPADSPACKQNPNAGVAPPSTKDALNKHSGFAAAGLKDPYTILPDGSIKLKNGKTYKASDFQDANALMATGMSAANAKDVMNALGAANFNNLANAAKDLKADPKKSTVGGTLADGTTTTIDINRGAASDKTYSDQLNKSAQPTEDRKPSSEGLAKEFNGELIGVAGDDIFLMMNRRYKLKSEQDSFIAQDRK